MADQDIISALKECQYALRTCNFDTNTFAKILTLANQNKQSLLYSSEFANIPHLIIDSNKKITILNKSLSAIYNNIDKCVKDVSFIILASLPQEILQSEDEYAGLVDPDLLDAEFVKNIRKILKCKSKTTALGYLIQLQSKLKESIIRLQSKYDKLTERARMQGSQTTEGRIAYKLREKIETSMNVLNLREIYIADKFYKIRKQIVEEMYALSQAYTSLFPEGNSEAYSKCKKYSIESTLTSIPLCDLKMNVRYVGKKPIKKR